MKKAILILLAALTLTLCGCGKISEKTFFALDTVIEFKVYGKIPDGAEKYVKDLERVFSKTDPDSELYSVNGKEISEPSAALYDLIEESLQICADTKGAFDITSGAVTALWDEATKISIPPDEAKTAEALGKCGYEKVKCDNGIITKPAGLAFDLGAVAKGRIADLTVTYLKERGVSAGFVSFGGGISVIGDKPDGSGYKIGIKTPDGDGIAGYTVIHKGTVSTSGDYERYFEYDGKRYHHIIDMSTGMPSESGVRSCTVISGSGTVSDALSTAIFADPSLLQTLYGAYDFEAVLIMEDKTVITTPDAGFVITEAGYSLTTLHTESGGSE